MAMSFGFRQEEDGGVLSIILHGPEIVEHESITVASPRNQFRNKLQNPQNRVMR
jgi:hypothetical protein